jgi:RNA polymerase sigma-70 factor, ECF subfamily
MADSSGVTIARPGQNASWRGQTGPAAQPQLNEDAVSQLARQAADGDRSAFATIYELLVDDVFRFARSACGDSMAAEDIVADVFLNAWRSAHTFDPKKAAYRGWLFAIARNEARRHLQRQSLAVTNVDPAILESIPEADGETAITEHRAVHEALTRLPEEERVALVLRYYAHSSFRDVGAALGKREGAARKLVFRALSGLRRELEASDARA